MSSRAKAKEIRKQKIASYRARQAQLRELAADGPPPEEAFAATEVTREPAPESQTSTDDSPSVRAESPVQSEDAPVEEEQPEEEQPEDETDKNEEEEVQEAKSVASECDVACTEKFCGVFE